MKRLTTVLFAFLAISLSTQAQQRKMRKNTQLTPKQHATLAVKRMTLALDLNKKQQKQMLPLLEQQAESRAEMMKTRAERRSKETKPSKEERFSFQNKQLDERIAFRDAIKEILDEKQFQKFQKIAVAKRMKGKKRMQERRSIGNTMKRKRGW